MGTIFSAIQKFFSSEKPVRILMLGLDAAVRFFFSLSLPSVFNSSSFLHNAQGKSTLLYQMKFGECLTTVPTIGFNVETVKHSGLTMTIFDVGGQHKIRPLWRHYLVNTDALIWVVDSSDLERLDGPGTAGTHPGAVPVSSHGDTARDELKWILNNPEMGMTWNSV
jgi:hypothetical protein